MMYDFDTFVESMETIFNKKEYSMYTRLVFNYSFVYTQYCTNKVNNVTKKTPNCIYKLILLSQAK